MHRSNINLQHEKSCRIVTKLSDAETEAAETQVWLEFAVKCRYLKRENAATLYKQYDEIIATLVGMIQHRDTWILK